MFIDKHIFIFSSIVLLYKHTLVLHIYSTIFNKYLIHSISIHSSIYLLFFYVFVFKLCSKHFCFVLDEYYPNTVLLLEHCLLWGLQVRIKYIYIGLFVHSTYTSNPGQYKDIFTHKDIHTSKWCSYDILNLEKRKKIFKVMHKQATLINTH